MGVSVLAAEEYKRAASANRANQCDPGAAIDLASRILRISWALSRVPALPTPDLAERLARAALELCGPDRGVAIQIGRMGGRGEWACESFGLAGRVHAKEPMEAMVQELPWPSIPERGETPVCLVSEPTSNHARMRSIAGLFGSVNLGIELAGLASSRRERALVLTVQVGGDPSAHRSGATGQRAAMLRQLLPWIHAIAQAAMGEGRGRAPRSWLTDRELVVLERLAEGGSVAEIAQALGRSKYTVHDQVKSLHRKLGVHSRAALVGCATRGVPPPGADGAVVAGIGPARVLRPGEAAT